MSAQDPTADLGSRCAAVYGAAGAAIDWILDVRPGCQRLDRESDSLIQRLRRARNHCRRLGRTATRPVSVGVFGLSQAGKSYLISALAADASGRLQAKLDDTQLDFLTHYNPPGRGKEATGLVTRFTRHPQGTNPSGYPVRLALFSEVDLVKVLGNAFFNDFNREVAPFEPDPAELREQLQALRKRRLPAPDGAVDPEAIIDLMGYFELRFPRSTSVLRSDYWPGAVALAPVLAPADRAELFSVLWGGVRELTDTFRTLIGALAELDHAAVACCPLAALVEPEGDGWKPGHSIMNVDVLDHLGRADPAPVEVLPLGADGSPGTLVALPRPVLAALTAELEFALATPSVAGLVEQADLLDFPGYRGRLDISDLDEVRSKLGDDQADPVAQLVLRGKVAYLFERYTDDQEMNCLVLCAPSDTQSEVKDLGPVIEDWVHATQGADASTRARRASGLVWAITKFDRRLEPGAAETPELLRQSWDGLMKLALLERFGAYDWLREWAPDRPFDTLFLVRKPGLVPVVLPLRDGREEAPPPEQQMRLGRLRETFRDNPAVRRHIHDAPDAWDAMLLPNDGGISRLATYLIQVATADAKHTRVAEQIEHLAREISDDWLGPYFQAEGAARAADQERIAAALDKALRERPDRLGDLIASLQPCAEHLRSVYLRSDDESPANKGRRLIANLPGSSGGVGSNADTRGGSESFARRVKRDWIGQLKGLADQPNLSVYIDLPQRQLDDLVDQLIIAADRLGLEQDITAATSGIERQTSARRAQLAGRQAALATGLVSAFVSHLGLATTPPAHRPSSLALEGAPLFNPPEPVPDGELPRLGIEPADFSGAFIVNWLEALRLMIVGNADYAEGRDIKPEQNHRLDLILADLRTNQTDTQPPTEGSAP